MTPVEGLISLELIRVYNNSKDHEPFNMAKEIALHHGLNVNETYTVVLEILNSGTLKSKSRVGQYISKTKGA